VQRHGYDLDGSVPRSAMDGAFLRGDAASMRGEQEADIPREPWRSPRSLRRGRAFAKQRAGTGCDRGSGNGAHIYDAVLSAQSGTHAPPCDLDGNALLGFKTDI